MPQIASADAALPAVFRELDPYADVRVESQIAPFLGSPPAVRDTARAICDEIFVYLGEVTAPDSPLLGAIGALARQGHRVRAYLPLLDPEKTAELTAAGAQLSPEPVPFADIARRSRIAVTTGGLGLASSALACGLPLAVLPTDLEKMLNGRALERIGTGRSIAIKDAGRPKTADEIAGASRTRPAMQAWHGAQPSSRPEFRKRLEHDPADAVADTVMELAESGK